MDTKGDKGGKGGGGKGASGGKGSKEPTQRMLDLAKKAVAETGKKPECWYHKNGGCPYKGCPFWHGRANGGRLATARGLTGPQPEDDFVNMHEADFEQEDSSSDSSN